MFNYNFISCFIVSLIWLTTAGGNSSMDDYCANTGINRSYCIDCANLSIACYMGGIVSIKTCIHGCEVASGLCYSEPQQKWITMQVLFIMLLSLFGAALVFVGIICICNCYGWPCCPKPEDEISPVEDIPEDAVSLERLDESILV